MTPVHLHLMLNHAPIFGSVLVLGLLAWGLGRRDWSYSRLALILAVLVGVLAIPVYLTGEPTEHTLQRLRSLSHPTVEAHEDAAAWAFVGLEAIAVFATGLLWKARKSEPSRALLVTFAAVSIIVTAAVVRTAYLGGQITHTELVSELPPRP